MHYTRLWWGIEGWAFRDYFDHQVAVDWIDMGNDLQGGTL